MAWLLAVLPAVLGGTAGLMMVVSVARPVRQKDPHRRSGPFDTGDDPNAAGALIGPPLSRARSAARGVLLTAGILLIVPQGLVPIGFNLFGVDPQVRVWFAARYLPSSCRSRWRPPWSPPVCSPSGGPPASGAQGDVPERQPLTTTSSGWPGRPMRTSLPNWATFSSGMVAGISGVQTGPGATALTRMPGQAWGRRGGR